MAWGADAAPISLEIWIGSIILIGPWALLICWNYYKKIKIKKEGKNTYFDVGKSLYRYAKSFWVCLKSKKKKKQPLGLYWLSPPQISFAPFFSIILSANNKKTKVTLFWLVRGFYAVPPTPSPTPFYVSIN